MKKLKIRSRFKEALLLLGIWFLIYKFIKRSDLIEVIQKSLPSDEGSLMAGMVWGEKGLISKDLYSLLLGSGLIHLVVVSGANLTIVGKNIIENLAAYLGRKRAIIYGGLLILIYINLSGWQIPVIRAGLFLMIYYWSQILGRQFRGGRALIVVVLIMFLANFKILKEVSFWLSVAAFLGLLLSGKEGGFKNTIWVSLFILPILSINFGTINLISPFVNILVLFLVQATTMIGFIGSLVGLLWRGSGRFILSLSYPMLRYLIEVVEMTGKWQWAQLNFQFNWMILIGWYLVIGAYWYGKKKI